MAAWWQLNRGEDHEDTGSLVLSQDEFNQCVMKFNRHEMLRSSIFGETPLLKLEKAQPLILTHEMIKRSIENLGFSTDDNEGPFIVETQSGHRIRADGWEQIGGYFEGIRYGVWISPAKLRAIKMWMWISIILIIPTFGVALIPTIWLAVWYSNLMNRLNKSKIVATVIYTGFRKMRDRDMKLGRPMLDSVLESAAGHGLGPMSEFMSKISHFEASDGKPGALQFSISYSLHTRQESVRKTIDEDFTRLGQLLMRSMAASTQEYSPVPEAPEFIRTETQINPRDDEFNSKLRFPVAGQAPQIAAPVHAAAAPQATHQPAQQTGHGPPS